MSVLPNRLAVLGPILGLGLGLALLGNPSATRAEGFNTPSPPTLTGAESVHAAFISAAGTEGIRSVQMFLDGREVTGAADVGALRVAYKPGEKLSPGTHDAKVVVVDSLGRTFTKEWTFDVTGEERPEVVAFFSETLAIDLDPLSRRLMASAVTVGGTTLPGAEVSMRLEQDLVARVVAGASGRFSARVELAEGENELTVSAARLDTLEEGVELTRRIERVTLKDIAPTRPPTTWTGRPGRDGAVAAPVGASVGATPQLEIPEVPTKPAPATTQPRARDERVASRVEAPVLGDPEIDIPEDPDDPGDPDDPPPVTDVVITKPTDGEALRVGHVTVLGRAPAGWTVVVFVDGRDAGDDVANPAGHFTVPRVELGGGGEHELIAEATSSEGQSLRSAAVQVRVAGAPSLSADAQASDSAVAPVLEALADPGLRLLSPSRRSTVVRGGSLRVEGLAWDGAQVDIEVNGRVVVTEIAGANGRFVADVPLEAGSNLLAIEAVSQDGSRMHRSDTFLVTGQTAPRPRQGPGEIVPIKGGPPRGFPTIPGGTATRPIPTP